MKKLLLPVFILATSALLAQEPAKENNKQNTPPSSGKSISEKGVKTRNVKKKKKAESDTTSTGGQNKSISEKGVTPKSKSGTTNQK